MWPRWRRPISSNTSSPGCPGRPKRKSLGSIHTSSRNSAAPWPVSTMLLVFFLLPCKDFLDKIFCLLSLWFSRLAEERNLPLGACLCCLIASSPILRHKYMSFLLLNVRQTLFKQRTGKQSGAFLETLADSCLCYQVHSGIDLAPRLLTTFPT